MYQPKKQVDPIKLRLPKQSQIPDGACLSEIKAHVLEQAGREVEVLWALDSSNKTYNLIAKLEPAMELPSWFVWEEENGQTHLVWSDQTVDLQFVQDVLLMLDQAKPAASPAATGDFNADPLGHPAASPHPAFQAAATNQSNLPPSGPNPFRFGPEDKSLSGQKPEELAPAPEAPVDPLENSNSAKALSSLSKAAAAIGGKTLSGLTLISPQAFDGDLDHFSVATLLRAISPAHLTGKLEVRGEESVGTVYFEDGTPQHATTSSRSGDQAISEIVTWRTGLIRFVVDERTQLRSVNNRLESDVMDGVALLDQKKHLESAGLTHESYLVKKHKSMSESELKVSLMKGSEVDFAVQAEIYGKIGARCTLADLLRDRPMETALWTAILFNFLTCGLIEIKPPDAMARGVLDFLGDTKASVQAVETQLLRPETNLFTYPAFLYLLQYEFFRYEAYGWPVTIALFDMSRRSQQLNAGLDLIGQHEASVAIKRIELLKRPLDSIAHFETLNYALLFPNTRASAGAFVANRILQALTAVPLSSDLDKKNLHLAFGIASIPSDGHDIESVLKAAKIALIKARDGDFQIVVAHGPR